MKKHIKVYLHNSPYKIGNVWKRRQVSYLYSMGMTEDEFAEANREQIENELITTHAENYTGSDDAMINSAERYVENRRDEYVSETYEETKEAYNDIDWDRGYQTPEGREYVEMTAQGYVRNQNNQVRYLPIKHIA